MRSVGSGVSLTIEETSAPKREFVLLGTGTSIGVPAIGCQCTVCTSDDPRLHRTRASAVIVSEKGTILIDCGPDLRQQCLREKIGRIDAVLMTHQHADHILGMDDLRIFCYRFDGEALPILCEPDVEEAMRRSFWYAFDPQVKRHSKYAIPTVEFRRIDRPRFSVAGMSIEPIPLRHGYLDVLGFRVGNLAYCTDVNEIPAESWPMLEGLDTLILDALRLEPHPTHFSLKESLDVIEKLKPKRAFLTHVSCRLDPVEAAKLMPEHVALAYDGQRISF